MGYAMAYLRIDYSKLEEMVNSFGERVNEGELEKYHSLARELGVENPYSFCKPGDPVNNRLRNDKLYSD